MKKINITITGALGKMGKILIKRISRNKNLRLSCLIDIKSGKQFRLKGKGMPIIRSDDYGDLYLETNVIIPESLSKEQKDLLEKFKSLEDLDNNSEIKNFINKAKKFWSGN